MASVSTLSFLKSRLYSKSRLFDVKFHFGHKILFLKSRLYVKSRFVKSGLYCIKFLKCIIFWHSEPYLLYNRLHLIDPPWARQKTVIMTKNIVIALH